MKIDIVYLWVDSSDKTWHEKRKKYKPDTESLEKDAFADYRFLNNDELKYSLRSVEKYAPWINNIFIVTDNQIPEWLNLSNPKIQIIDHTEIIPKEKLPLFNSCAIESRIPYIQNLSEYFLYANDDTFFWDSVTPEFFFINEKPIIRFRKNLNLKKNSSIYRSTLKRAYDTIAKKYNIPIEPQVPHHNIDAYRKSLFLECIKEFEEEFNETINHRYRELSDMQRIGVDYYMLAKELAIPKFVELNWFQKHLFKTKADSRYFGIKTSKLQKLKTMNTKLLCINDTHEATVLDRIQVKTFLQNKFPEKSEFEK